MTNLAQEARNKAQVRWPGASVHSRGRSWIRHQHPTKPNHHMLDAHIGPIHYGAGQDAEIDTAWEPSSLQPWLHQMVKADFNVYVGPGTTSFDAGQIVRYVHPSSGQDVTFQAQQLQWTNDLNQIEAIADPQPVSHSTIDDDTIYWQGAYGPGLDFHWQAQTSKLAKYLTIKSLSAIGSPPQFIIDGGTPVLKVPFIFQKSSDIDIYIDDILWNEKSNNPQITEGNVEFKLAATGELLWCFNQAFVEDSRELDDFPPAKLVRQRLRAQAQNLFVEILIPWEWLLSAVYPVVIDPTIDDQVDTGTDDGYVKTDGYYYDSTVAYVGRTPQVTAGRIWALFDGISGLSGDDIDVSYFEPRINTLKGSATKTNIYAEYGASPAYPTTQADYDGRTTTTAYVAWDDNTSVAVFVQSPSINTIIQELADNYDPSTILILWKDDGSGNNNYLLMSCYEQSSSFAAKLHIEHSTPVPPSENVPEKMYQYRQRRT